MCYKVELQKKNEIKLKEKNRQGKFTELYEIVFSRSS